MRLCPTGLEEICNFGGTPIARIERNSPFDVRQTLGFCGSSSCVLNKAAPPRQDWLTANKGILWFCDEDCLKSHAAQLKAAKKAAADAAAAKEAAKVARINAKQVAR